jgi:hypothetical protein
MSCKIKMLLIFLLCSCVFAGETVVNNSLVTSKKAIEIAEKKLVQVYGKSILKQRPFQASLENNNWIVSGTLHCKKDNFCKGGVGIVRVSAQDGKIIDVTHEK